MKNRSIPFLLMIYVGVLGTVILGVGFALFRLPVTAESAAPSEREKTVLDERIASAREIKAALAKPIPQPERLGPITATLANPRANKVASSEEKKTKKIPRAALNAMAMEQSSGSSISYAIPDHAVGGW